MAVPAGPDPTVAFHRFQATGDPKALAAVFDATAVELLRVASHLVSDLHVAEDLVQSTFLAAIEHRNRFAPDHEVLPWLLGILTNHARRHRSGQNRRPDPERVAKPSVLAPEEAATELELTRAVSDAIGRLPEPYRPVLMLHLRHGFSAQEIALDLGRPPATVRQQLRRGLEKLRRTLPAGVASACGLAAGGLAQVRAAVLRHVAAVQPVTLVLGGALVMKKMILGVSCVLAALAVWLTVSATMSPSALPKEGIAGQAPRVSQANAVTTNNTDLTTDRSILAKSTAEDAAAGKATAGSTLTVRGTVEAPRGGRPVPGASVLVADSYGRGEVVAHTDDAGRFTLEEVELGRTVSAFADGWAPCRVRVVEGDPGTELELTLELSYRGVSLRGQVLGPDGKPVADARIMVGLPGGNYGWTGSQRITSPLPLWLRSDANGRFRTRSAPPRSPVHVHHQGLAAWSGKLEGNDTELVVSLKHGGTLKGRVLDATGSPLAGARIYIGKPHPQAPSWHTLRQRSDEDGRFEIRGIPPGNRRV